MKKNNLWITILLIILSLCFTLGLTACGGGDSNGGGTSTEKSFTINCATEMMAGDRIEITITKSYEFDMYHDDYEWKIVGDNTVGGSFEFEDLDKSDNYTNKFFRATQPGKVQIQAINTTSGTLTSNIVEITVNGNYINTVDELKAIANTNKSYILGANIDLSSESNWTPIEGFTGTLSGGGYSISNLTIDSVNGENLGLFGTLQGTVQNLTIENAQIASRGDIGKAGIVAGTNSGVIKNVIVNGSVVANYYDNVGGIVGYNNNGIISNCENQALIIGNNNVGGIAGYNSVNGNNQADQNVNNGEVSGNTNIGGIFGYLTSKTVKTDDNFSYAIAQNENNNAVKGKNNVGGIIGNITPAGKYASNWYGVGYFTISVFTNNGEVTATGDCVGGIIGYAERLSEITVSENNANITGSNFVGGYVGKSGGTTIRIAENNSVITGKGYVGGIAGYAGRIENATNNGDIVSTAIIVEDGASRSYVGGIAGFCTAIINSKNTTNIIVNNAGSFVGGLVGYLRVNGNEQLSGNENLGDVQGKDSVGGIVGYATMSTVKTDDNFNYSFSDNTNNGSVNGTNEVGGIVGNLVGAGKYASNWYGLGYFDVSLCENNAEIIGTGNNVGGIVGNATRLATMTVCENNADVTGNNCIGGYVGNGSGANIKLATNNNAISGKGYVGGIAGVAGKVENSTNNGVINSTGVVVENSTSMSYVGGIAGYCTGLINCTNNSDINVSTGGQFVGGLAGYILFNSDNQINDNQNYGKITGSKYTGGIAGYIQSTTVKTDDDYTRSIGTNKNYGSVNGTDYVAGIFGYVYGAGKYASNWYGVCYIILTYCENQAEISGSSCVGGIVGGYTRLKTDANLMDTNTTLYGEKLGQ